MSDLGHLMIMASAGSGKTYALTTRFVRLLAMGAAPERIVALTFTRKAAGEFFDAILNRLARAASDEVEARKLGQGIERPELKAADFLSLLEAMISVMPRLNLGTLDGFFARMVQAFPMELGLTGEFALLEEAEARQERQRVLGMIFTLGSTSTQARDDFIEAFKRATYGVEEKALQRSLDSFLDQHGEAYRSAPDRSVWGNPERIWTDSSPVESKGELSKLADALEAEIKVLELSEKQQGRMEAFFLELEDWTAGANLPTNVDFVVRKTLEVADELRQGNGEVMIDRKRIALDPKQGRLWLGVVEAIVAAELKKKLQVTRGIHDVLAYFESVYHNQVRRAGKLTFADVQRLLEPGAETGLAAERDLIDWRLDAQFDHWLLDEFQDTSRGQWAILRNLVDETIQDPERARSFFYVGDVKQAIYAWRGGDARLFREIFDYYNSADAKAIEEQHLSVSWRSTPPVIEMVNAICGDRGGLEAIAPAQTVERWMTDWRPHESADPSGCGYAELRAADSEDTRFEETLSILQEVDPVKRGLTVAVLVQKNDTGARLAEYLRTEGGLAALAESDLRIAYDNPLTSALLALLKSAAHPGDTMASELVKMTPLAKVLEALGWGCPAEISHRILREIHVDGFAGMLTLWMSRVEPHLADDDEFSRLRGRQLIEAARSFDQHGDRNVSRFLEWMESYRLREVVAPGMIRVLTVHKAKGLGFDLVILPDLQGQTIARRRDGLAVHRDEDHQVDWVLDLPIKQLAESDDVLKQQLADESAEGAYESLCKLYVALTRAKRALYVIVEPAGRSKSKNYPKLFSSTLGEAWQTGDSNWFEGLAGDLESEDESSLFSFPAGEVEVKRQRRREARTPSAGKSREISGKKWFCERQEDHSKRGTTIHEELARIGWADDLAKQEWAEGRVKAGVDEELMAEIVTCLEADALRPVFYRPEGAGKWEVWVERAFEVVLGSRWVSGIFDRVVLNKDESGEPREVWVYDFKTRPLDSREDREIAAREYDEQLRLYRKVVEKLTGLRSGMVHTSVVFTAIAERVGAE